MHFNQFSPRVAAFGRDLAADIRQRAEFLARTQQETHEMLERFRSEQRQIEAERKRLAAESAEARHLFVRDLKSEVYALLSRFELHRQDMAADLANMASQVRRARVPRRQHAQPRWRVA